MILKKDVHHPNDISFKYLATTEPKKLHSYFKLPGKFVRNYPTKIIKRDGSEREMDWLIVVDADDEQIFKRTLINAEFQSYPVDFDKIEVIADYSDYGKTYYGMPLLSIIIITDGYERSEKEFQRTASDILKPIYIHMTWEEITEKLNNLEKKILNHEKLSDDEAMDFAFLPMFAPKNKAKFVTEKLARLFNQEKTITGTFRNNIAYVLTIMIRKYFDGTPKGKELLKLAENEISKSDLIDVIEYELDYRDRAHKAEIEKITSEKDAEIEKINLEKNEEIKKINLEKNAEIEMLKAKLAENGID